MNPARRPLILRILVVLFAASLMGGYVVYSQNRSKPRIVKGTKSLRVLEDLQATDEAIKDIKESHAAQSSEVTMPGSKLGLVFSGSRIIDLHQGETEIEIIAEPDPAFLSTKSGAPLIPPKSIQLRVTKPTPEPFRFQEAAQPQQTSRASAPGSKSGVPLIPADVVLPQQQPATQSTPTAPTFAPGSKVKVPIFQVRPRPEEPRKAEEAK